MSKALLTARNPDPDSSLPSLVLIPLGSGIVLRTRETWPRTSKVYCHRHDAPWPEDAEIVDEVALTSVSRRGAAIDIVADRTREARSQFVITRARGREMIFWQSARVAKAARPNIAHGSSRRPRAARDRRRHPRAVPVEVHAPAGHDPQAVSGGR